MDTDTQRREPVTTQQRGDSEITKFSDPSKTKLKAGVGGKSSECERIAEKPHKTASILGREMADALPV